MSALPHEADTVNDLVNMAAKEVKTQQKNKSDSEMEGRGDSYGFDLHKYVLFSVTILAPQL